MMNKKLGMYGSAANFISVLGFAVSMLFGFDYGSYFSSMFIALSFVTMVCGYAFSADNESKSAGYVSIAFAVALAFHTDYYLFAAYRESDRIPDTKTVLDQLTMTALRTYFFTLFCFYMQDN